MEPQYGYWWLADRPDERSSGVLEQNAHGELRLTLHGRLGAKLSPSGWPEGARRILGEGDMGVIISLDRCFVRQAPGSFGLQRQVWHVHEAVIGAKFDPLEAWAFYGAQFEIPLLTQWAHPNHIADFLDRNDGGRPARLGIAVCLKNLALWERGGVQVELSHSASVRAINATTTALEAPVRLCAYADRALATEEFREIAIRPLQVLVGLATGRFTAAVSADVLLSPRDSEKPTHFVPWHWQPLRAIARDHETQYGFNYADIVALGADRLDAWIAKQASMDPVFDLYLGLLRETGIAELSFLIVVQALETYHRRTNDDTVLSSASWEPLREGIATLITAATSGSERMAFINKLKFYNEVSLRHRLKALLGGAAGEICGQGGASFINAVVTTRNYYTHWDAQSESGALRGPALVHATSRLTALLEILLLRDVGFGIGSAPWNDVLRRRVSWLPKTA
jgi:hypothetical protein